VGDYQKGEVYLEEMLDAHRLMPSNMVGDLRRCPAVLIPLIGYITGVSSRQEIARTAARDILSSPATSPFVEMVARAGLGLIAILNEDADEAQVQYDILRPVRAAECSGIASTDRLLGLLAQTMGELDLAAEHFADSLAFCRNAGYRPELAWTCHDYAEGLLKRNGPGDHTKAMSLLDESFSIASELGMKPLMERVIALQDRAQSQPARAEAYPDGLSQREVEVLRLIAHGMTDREIAEALIISARTVGTHVSNILNKIGAINRTEAASYANRHGLV